MPSDKKNQSEALTHLIVIRQPSNDLHLKEYLDIALVSASYDIHCAVFFYDAAIKAHIAQPVSQLTQSFNMLGEFGVSLFGESNYSLYKQPIQKKSLDTLTTQSQHVWPF